MATVTTPNPLTPPADLPPGLRPYRLTVDEYERIATSGALGRNPRVILWDGLLVEKVSDMTKGRPHVVAQNRLVQGIQRLLPPGYFAEQDQPIALRPHSEPEPDLKVVRGRIDDYAEHPPTPADCPLVAEVADSSLEDDSGVMLRAYGAAGVPVYWVVNLRDRTVDVYEGPSGPKRPAGYETSRSYGPDEEVPVVLDGAEIGRLAARGLLG